MVIPAPQLWRVSRKSGVDKPRKESEPYALRYSDFVVPLVKALQQKMIDLLQKEITELKKRTLDSF